ncbi:hypothetical protein GCM10007390_49410 [Persicitalea jodogahamensis]|uniref:Uncharacterized protein n=2 Tax=Persicitalea jodogahamensis TaxID=402147 RepID=A0A8J3D8H7_9BACT|nr:hypothetical protein GCM10007390_49410 [Persicitalea jodogahamensis]
MMDKEDDPEKIIIQFKAVNHGIDSAYNLLLDEVFRKALAARIVEGADACPGDCGNEEMIESIRIQFPTLKFDELGRKLKEINRIVDAVNAYNSKITEI